MQTGEPSGWSVTI